MRENELAFSGLFLNTDDHPQTELALLTLRWEWVFLAAQLELEGIKTRGVTYVIGDEGFCSLASDYARDPGTPPQPKPAWPKAFINGGGGNSSVAQDQVMVLPSSDTTNKRKQDAGLSEERERKTKYLNRMKLREK